jgi:hypothetical protein
LVNFKEKKKKMKKNLSIFLILCLIILSFQGIVAAETKEATSAIKRVENVAREQKSEREMWGWISVGIGVVYLTVSSALYFSAPEKNEFWGILGGVFGIFFLHNGYVRLHERSEFERVRDDLKTYPLEEREGYAAGSLRAGADRAKRERELILARRTVQGLLGQIVYFWELPLLHWRTSERPVEKEYREYLKERYGSIEAESIN